MILPAAFRHAPSSSRHLPELMRQTRAGLGLRLQLVLFGLVVISLLALPLIGFAQVGKPLVPASVATTATKPPAVSKATATSKPVWTELTPLQQQTLKPLALSWSTLSEAQKRKWLEISKNYHSLPPEGQATMHGRMSEWVALSPQQRAEARLNFAKTKELSRQLTPDEKKAKWQTYQALSPEEKQKLAAKATTRPVGAATAVKPVSPQKLAAVPPHGTKPDARLSPKIVTLPAAPTSPAAVDTPPGTTSPAPQP